MFWTNLITGGAIVAIASFLTQRNMRAHQAAEKHRLSEPELEFFARQHRRRLQANVMLAIVGAAIVGSTWLQGALTQVIYWSVVLAIVIWITLLALADLANTRAFYRIAQADHVAEHARLLKELRDEEDNMNQQGQRKRGN